MRRKPPYATKLSSGDVLAPMRHPKSLGSVAVSLGSG